MAALLAEQGDYSFVDKLGYSPTPDLAALYLKEALRDLHSLISGGRLSKEGVKTILQDVDWERVDREISEVARSEDRRELREKVSVITAQALALSAKLISGG